MEQYFFPQRPAVTPTIYAYRLIGVDSHKGYLKVGYTDRTAKERIEEQLHTSKVNYEIVLVESAMSNDGSCFTDKDVHRILERKGHTRLNPLDKTDEWFRCSVTDVMAAILSLRTGATNEENRTQNFAMRPEQYRAVDQTKTYFEQALKEEPNRIPKFLWNAKMRFGKTFASYQLAKKMGLSRILILTFKPAVESAWREDLVSHIDFEGWQYISNKDARNNNLNIDQEFKHADKTKPIVVFGSFQDLLGTNESGGINTKNEFIHATHWDLVISMNITSVLGKSVPRNCSRRKMKKLPLISMPKNTKRTRQTMPSTNRGCLSLPNIICSCRELRSELSTTVSSSKNKSSTGRIRTNNEPKQNGKAATILIRHCHEW